LLLLGYLCTFPDEEAGGCMPGRRGFGLHPAAEPAFTFCLCCFLKRCLVVAFCWHCWVWPGFWHGCLQLCLYVWRFLRHAGCFTLTMPALPSARRMGRGFTRGGLCSTAGTAYNPRAIRYSPNLLPYQHFARVVVSGTPPFSNAGGKPSWNRLFGTMPVPQLLHTLHPS